jgi:hypothetical protein
MPFVRQPPTARAVSFFDPAQSKTEPFYAGRGLRRTPPIFIGEDRLMQGRRSTLLAAPIMR